MAQDPILAPRRRRLAARPLVLAAVALLLFLSAVGTAGAASRGEIDSSFGVEGATYLELGLPRAQIVSAATQPDGKVVLVGSTVAAGDASNFLVIRLDEHGNLDPSFSADGVQMTDFDGFGDGATAVAIAPDGKIVVAGFASQATVGGDRDLAVARYDSDGNPDLGFSGDGRQTVDFGGGSEGAQAVAVQPDGKVLVGGNANPTETAIDFAVARLDADGELDPSFAGDGKQSTDFNGTSDAVRELALRPDGKIVACGYTDTGANVYDFALARYDADGGLDPAFSGDGKETTDFSGGATDDPTGMALLPDGRIVAGGFSGEDFVGFHFTVARYEADGGLDPSFSADGVTTVQFPPSGEPSEVVGPYSIARTALTVDADGTVYLAGSAEYFDEFFETHSEIAVAALLPDGSLDPGFSGDGMVTVRFEAGNSSATAAALDPEGRLDLAGTVAAEGGSKLVTVRLFGSEPTPPAEEPQPPADEPRSPPPSGSGAKESPPGPAGSAAPSGSAPNATTSRPSVACRRASAGLKAARRRVEVAHLRFDAARQRLRRARRAAGPKRKRALLRRVERNRTRFENTQKNRARAGRKAVARC